MAAAAVSWNPVVLEGMNVRLEPLSESHLDGLTEVGLDDDLWRLIPTRVQVMWCTT